MIHIDDLKYRQSSLELIDEIEKRVLVLDGAMGTMIQQYRLDEDGFRGEQFKNHPCNLKGCNDVLSVSAPNIIKDIHLLYLNAGASIIETNSFNANALSLREYELHSQVRSINYAAAKIARKAVDEFMRRNSKRKCWVAGSVGPTSKSLSMASTLDDEVSWDELVEAYICQISALIDGGVDVLLIETIFDTINAKAAIYAARRAMEQCNVRVPIMLSVTLTEASRTLSGQTIDAFVASMSHCEPLSIGLNCGFGAETMSAHIKMLQNLPCAVSMYPNAGLPNEMGKYDQTPEIMASKIAPMLNGAMLNIVGGCCGTTPQHIKKISTIAAEASPRKWEKKKIKMTLSGLDAYEISETRNFLNIGERCNVAGSRKFLRLINEGSLDEAVSVACKQVESGAQVIDINMDDSMLDAKVEMSRFIMKLGTEPVVAKVPFMIDSSKWEVITSALKLVQGKPIVNSISLKDGEAAFLSKARYIREMGAAVVVMAFDEEGQADTFERKINICRRAYILLTEKAHFPACDIIFDPNILAVATGIKQHNNYAVDFIRAVEWIKNNLPDAKVSGGVSNLSFSFRGNNYIREAMHAIFLYHAIAVGMDMAIVNAASLMPIDEISFEVRTAIEDVLFNRDDDATMRLIELAQQIKTENNTTKIKGNISNDITLSVAQQIENKLIKGSNEGLDDLLSIAHNEEGAALQVIDGILMPAMNKVGKLFAEGRLFLPQVVKCAQTMKAAVEYLTPFIEKEKSKNDGKSTQMKMVIATVKGDVHDIGKNIVSVIMSCNGVEVVDMGVMVPGDEIIKKALEINADFIALSGLITPSLDEMCHVARLMEEKKMTIPLLIGGATASELHTAVKIAPCYSNVVIYIKDAAMIPEKLNLLYNGDTAFVSQLKNRQELLRVNYNKSTSQIDNEQARKFRFPYDGCIEIHAPNQSGVHNLTISILEAIKFINWRAFFDVWKLAPSYAEIFETGGCACCEKVFEFGFGKRNDKEEQAVRLWNDAQAALRHIENVLKNGMSARVALVPAGSRDEDIVYYYNDVEYILNTPRQKKGDDYLLALADFVKPIGVDNHCEDWIGMFVVTTGLELRKIVEEYQNIGDEYKALLYQSLADRLVEAATEIMYKRVRESIWGFPGKGIRPAIGFPSLPDQRLVFLADKVLNYSELGVMLTENGAMYPPASTTGYIIAHPQARYFQV